jgi:hypothetical protein
MDPRRFDSLVRTLGTAASRRRALAALLASLAAPLIPALDGEAKRKQRKRRGKGRGRGNDVRQEGKDRGKGKSGKNRKQPSD